MLARILGQRRRIHHTAETCISPERRPWIITYLKLKLKLKSVYPEQVLPCTRVVSPPIKAVVQVKLSCFIEKNLEF